MLLSQACKCCVEAYSTQVQGDVVLRLHVLLSWAALCYMEAYGTCICC